MARITKDMVKHVADLARLEISEEELEEYTHQLDSILSYVEQINELDTSDVMPTTHVLEMKNVLREDIPEPGLPRDEVLKNAPDHKDGQIRVPAILD